ncbi:MAG: hypothetical protein KBC81_02550 [Candidatus Pacebacteria bacterium]|nr:hypothetical protein [Candidatus Paceibacterota bacterium]
MIRRICVTVFLVLISLVGISAQQPEGQERPALCTVPPAGGTPYVSVYVQGEDGQPLSGNLYIQAYLYKYDEMGQAMQVNMSCGAGATCFDQGRMFMMKDFAGNPIPNGQYMVRAYAWDMYLGDYASEVLTVKFMVDGPTNITLTLPNIKYRMGLKDFWVDQDSKILYFTVPVNQAASRDGVDIFATVGSETGAWMYTSRGAQSQKMVMPEGSNTGDFMFALPLSGIPEGFWGNINVMIGNTKNHNDVFASFGFSVLVPEWMSGRPLGASMARTEPGSNRMKPIVKIGDKIIK